jgi:NAD(P)-dependent dehydrogenase (short-subunit alcohol dehydrogenase family)
VGRAIALGLAGAGSNVALHFHSSGAAAASTADEIRALGVKVATIAGDLGEDPAAVFAACGNLAPVRILVNNAAVFPADRLTDVTATAWERTSP